MVQVEVTTPLEAVEAVLAGARFVVCSGMDADMLAGTVRQVRASTMERVEIAAAGGFTLEDAKEFAQTGVDHLCVDDLLTRAVTFRLALQVTRSLARIPPPEPVLVEAPALVPAQRG
jgi:nicotinate-nucleotide pyrophosphorylase (carboxylating)